VAQIVSHRVSAFGLLTCRLVLNDIPVLDQHAIFNANAPVSLVKDDEFADRFWLRVYGDGPMAEFVLAADDLTEFTVAVAQVVQDLQS